ncbi:MAG TPA: mechanosensitive ion channel family protein [Pyrinomonadaceae bacterium]|nr:mechanosensitive ion channel family protein [Pyrinomonadaceae bacterium]
MMFYLQTPTPNPTRTFDPNIMWQVFRNLGASVVARVPYLLFGLIAFIIFLVIARILKTILITAGERTRLDITLAELLARLVSAATIILGLLVAAVIIFPTFRPGDLIAGLGITSVAIGFAFKDVLQNFFAGILILWRRPFIVGDEIKIREFEGTVEDITTRSTRVKTYDGERAILPNGDVYTSALLVRNAYESRRVRVTVGIGYKDSIESARKIIHDVLGKTKGVLGSPEPWVYVSELAPSSVNLTLYFWTGSRQANVLKLSDEVATAVKNALDQAHIDIPYPQVVVHPADGQVSEENRRPVQ